NDEPGPGAVDAREGAASGRSRTRGVFELVRPHGPRKHRGRHREALRPHALSQELDPVPLCGEAPDLLAEGAARDPADRADGPFGGAAHLDAEAESRSEE